MHHLPTRNIVRRYRATALLILLKWLLVIGSYRLFVALSVLFKGGFHCPYCGEETAMQARQPRHR